MTVTLTLPFPPSVNTYYRRGMHATYLSPQGREYKAKVADMVSALGLGAKLPPESRLAVFLGLSSPTKRAYDIDNRVKAILDALQDAGVFDDDEQIDRITVVRMKPTKGGFCSVVIVEEPCGEKTSNP